MFRNLPSAPSLKGEAAGAQIILAPLPDYKMIIGSESDRKSLTPFRIRAPLPNP